MDWDSAAGGLDRDELSESNRYFRADPSAGSLGLAFFVSEVVYNYTEAGFRMMFPLWIFFLLAVLGIPKAPAPQSLSEIAADFPEEIVEDELDFDHALDTRFREEFS